MLLALFALAALAALTLGRYTARRLGHYLTQGEGREFTRRTIQKLSPSEIEEIKKYADVFGLDNESITSTLELLQLGRNMAEYLGEEKIEEISALVRETVAPSARKARKSVAMSHRVKRVLQSCRLTHRNQSFSFTSRMVGGDRDGEHDSSLC